MAELHFVATGSFQYIAVVSGGMSQATFSALLQAVLSSMTRPINSFIQFPRNEDFANVKGECYALGHLSHVVGAIDGTHVSLVPPHTRR